jgi:hypothetical protein
MRCLCYCYYVVDLLTLYSMILAFEPVVKQKSEKDKLKELFPALCRPDDPAPKVSLCALT